MGIMVSHWILQAVFILLLTEDLWCAIIAALSYAIALVAVAVINMIILERNKDGKRKN